MSPGPRRLTALDHVGAVAEPRRGHAQLQLQLGEADICWQGRSIRPGNKVLFATDDTQNAIVHNVIVDAAVELIIKPFSLDTLAVRSTACCAP